jgi:FkbM family methyltransferase
LRRVNARGRLGGALKRAGKRAGLDVRRHRPPGLRRARLLAEHGVELVIDVGANRGQYAEELRRHGYQGRIVSFEPLSQAHAVLERRSAADGRWEVRQIALSDGDRTLDLGSADNFSSAMPVEQRLAGLFPEAVPGALERVPAVRLDQIDLKLPSTGRTLLKLDVEGYELRVLAGAAGILGEIGVVEAELSIVALHEGQPLLPEVIRALAEKGFTLLALEPTTRDWHTGEYLQFDGLFVRR